MAAAAAVALGLVFGGGSDGDVGQESAGNRVVELTYGPDWMQDVSGGRPIDGFRLEDPVALDYEPLSGAGILRAGLVAEPQAGGDPLPAALADRFAKRPEAEPVEVAGAPGLLYSGLTGGREAQAQGLLALMIPTDAGFVGIGCEAPADAVDELRPQCLEIAAAAMLRNVEAAGLGPDQETAETLESALSELGVAQTEAGEGLRSDRPAAQAEAAGRLSAAYEDAADKIVKPSATQGGEAVERVEDALRAGARGYEQLAAAARSENGTGYNAARAAISRATDDLKAGLDMLESFGYQLQ